MPRASLGENPRGTCLGCTVTPVPRRLTPAAYAARWTTNQHTHNALMCPPHHDPGAPLSSLITTTIHSTAGLPSVSIAATVTSPMVTSQACPVTQMDTSLTV